MRSFFLALAIGAILAAVSVPDSSSAATQATGTSATNNPWSILAVFVSILAATISLISFALTYRQRGQSDIVGIRPALVFVFDNRTGWSLRNIGNGPALNVIVAKKRPYGEWFDAVRVPPVAKDGKFLLHWIPIDDENGLGATYNDIRGRPYTTTTGADYSRIFEGHELPERIVVPSHPKFEDNDIRVYWEFPDLRRKV